MCCRGCVYCLDSGVFDIGESQLPTESKEYLEDVTSFSCMNLKMQKIDVRSLLFKGNIRVFKFYSCLK